MNFINEIASMAREQCLGKIATICGGEDSRVEGRKGFEQEDGNKGQRNFEGGNGQCEDLPISRKEVSNKQKDGLSEDLREVKHRSGEIGAADPSVASSTERTIVPKIEITNTITSEKGETTPTIYTEVAQTTKVETTLHEERCSKGKAKRKASGTKAGSDGKRPRKELVVDDQLNLNSPAIPCISCGGNVKFGQKQWQRHRTSSRHTNSPILEDNVNNFLHKYNTFVRDYDIRVREGLQASRKVPEMDKDRLQRVMNDSKRYLYMKEQMSGMIKHVESLTLPEAAEGPVTKVMHLASITATSATDISQSLLELGGVRNTPVQIQSFKYTLLEPIEKGGFGQVYIAAMHRGDKLYFPFIVKICDFLESQQTRGLEFGNLRQLRCESVVRCYGQHSDYLTQQMMMGFPYLNKIPSFIDGVMPPVLCQSWLIKILRCCVVIWKLNHVHRDLKPSNLMEDYKGDVILIDCWTACLIGEETPVLTHTIGFSKNSPVALLENDVYSVSKIILSYAAGKIITDDNEGLGISSTLPREAQAVLRQNHGTAEDTRVATVSGSSGSQTVEFVKYALTTEPTEITLESLLQLSIVKLMNQLPANNALPQ